MCGISGFSGTGSLEDLRRMSSRLSRRGPDAEGYWQAPNRPVYFGHRRLSVLDHVGGAQPMTLPEAGLVITFNGEIYNHRELRRELESGGAVFRTDHSDTEVLLQGYRAWGTSLPDHLDGMWSFVIFDTHRDLLFGSRDRFGEKPLYYSYSAGSGNFIFASQLDALIEHPQVSRTLQPQAIRKYFAHGYFPTPWTPYEGVYKLPAGHSFLYPLKEGRLRIFEYWDLTFESSGELNERILNDRSEEFLALLDRSVTQRMIADVPVGIFLSGGIDSSAVATSATRAPGKSEIRTFTLGFEETSFDESTFAAQVATLLKTQHSCKTLSISRLKTALQSSVAMLDEPLGDSSIVPTALLSEFTRQSVTVALSGDGGDELFAGYDPFLALRAAETYQKLVPRPVHEGLLAIASLLPSSTRNMDWSFRIRRALSGLSFAEHLWLPIWMAPLKPDEVAEICRPAQSPEVLYSETVTAWDRYPHLHPVNKLLYVFSKLYLSDNILTKVDRASMHFSLEVRAPFLSNDMVNFARKLPWQAKLNGTTRKYIVKRALKQRLPASILQRPKKGFGAPIAQWFKNGDLNFDTATPRYPSWLLPTFANERLTRHREGRSADALYLWSEWIFRQWLNR